MGEDCHRHPQERGVVVHLNAECSASIRTSWSRRGRTRRRRLVTRRTLRRGPLLLCSNVPEIQVDCHTQPFVDIRPRVRTSNGLVGQVLGLVESRLMLVVAWCCSPPRGGCCGQYVCQQLFIQRARRIWNLKSSRCEHALQDRLQNWVGDCGHLSTSLQFIENLLHDCSGRRCSSRWPANIESIDKVNDSWVERIV